MKAQTTHFQAILLALSAYALWVFYDTGNKVATEAGIPPGEVLVMIGATGFIVLFLAAVRSGVVHKLKPRKWRLVLLGNAFACASTLLNVIAVSQLSLSLFYVCIFSGPLMTAVLAFLILHEPLNQRKFLAIVFGFVGVIIAINPSVQGAGQGNVAGYFAVTLSAAAAASSWIVFRRVTQTESLWAIMAAFYGLIIFAGLFELMFFERSAAQVPSVSILAVMIGAGLFNIMARFLITYAVRHTTAANVTQCNYSQIVWAAGLAYVIWGDVPRLHLVLGAVIIIGAGMVMAREARRLDAVSMQAEH